MKIFLDFDDTIFNTAQFKADYMKLYLRAEITKEEFKNEYYTETEKNKQVFRKHDPLALIQRLEGLKNVSLRELKGEIDSFLDDTGSYVFEDFYDFVKEFSKESLGLLSYGDISFQSKKIAGAHIKQYFSVIKITDQHKGDVLKEIILQEVMEREKVVFIDDRPDKLLEVRNTLADAALIRILRNEGRYNDAVSPGEIVECKDLNQAADIIRRIPQA